MKDGAKTCPKCGTVIFLSNYRMTGYEPPENGAEMCEGTKRLIDIYELTERLATEANTEQPAKEDIAALSVSEIERRLRGGRPVQQEFDARLAAAGRDE